MGKVKNILKRAERAKKQREMEEKQRKLEKVNKHKRFEAMTVSYPDLNKKG